MAGTRNGLAEPDEPDPLGEVEVLITVTEEFVGVSLYELAAREGVIVGMETQEQSVSINASLPASQCSILVEAIIARTNGRGRVAFG